MGWQPGDLVITPFGNVGTVISDPQPVAYHTLVQLDDPDGVERINPRHFLTAALEPAPKTIGAQLSLLR